MSNDLMNKTKGSHDDGDGLFRHSVLCRFVLWTGCGGHGGAAGGIECGGATARGCAASGPDTSNRLHLLVGRSLVISSPTRVKRVSIADPNIADAIVISPFQVLLNGKTPGGVSLVIWDESDQSQTFEIFVDLDILGLSQKIREVFPNEPIRVEASKDLVMISGHASTKAAQNQILAIVSAVTPKVVNLMEAPTPPRRKAKFYCR